MPQLDKSTFFNQIFYFIVFSFILYLFMVKYGLPTVASAFKVRHYFYLQLKNKKINNVTSIFNDRLVVLLAKTSEITTKFIMNLRVELGLSYKKLSYFLLNHSVLISGFDKFLQYDNILNRFRFDKSSNATRYKEKQQKEVYKYNRS